MGGWDERKVVWDGSVRVSERAPVRPTSDVLVLPSLELTIGGSTIA